MFRTLAVCALFALSLGLVSAATVTGKVIGAWGKPVKGANVYLMLYGEQKAVDLRTDDAGGFAVEVDLILPRQGERLGQLFAYAPGYALTQAELKTDGNVIPLDPGTTLSGTVVDETGKPLAGVAVCLAVPEEWIARFTAHSGADGSWTLPGIPLAG